MPELPEVETTARGLRPRLLGRSVVSVGGVDWPRMLPNTSEDELRVALVGQAVSGVERRGKYLLLGFAECWLAIHRKMSGNLLLRPMGSPAERHTHLELGFDDGWLLRFVDARKFGRVYLFGSTAELDAFLAERLGPEPLDQLDADLLASLVRHRRARIKPLLLDQSFVAGIGNLYADEALWAARVHPLRTADSLSRDELRRLAAAIQRVLSQGIERRGTSFSNYRDADDTPGENQEFLNAYGRESQPCPRCGTPIARILIGQRSSYFCPREQRLKRPAASESASRSGTGRPRPGGTLAAATARAPRA